MDKQPLSEIDYTHLLLGRQLVTVNKLILDLQKAEEIIKIQAKEIERLKELLNGRLGSTVTQ